MIIRIGIRNSAEINSHNALLKVSKRMLDIVTLTKLTNFNHQELRSKILLTQLLKDIEIISSEFI